MITLTATLLSLAAGLLASNPPSAVPPIGASTLIVSETKTRTSGDGSQSLSQDRDTIVERVVSVNVAGTELLYDLPAETTAEQRFTDWHFPFRVLQPPFGAPVLLNRAELEERRDRWLARAGLTASACGHWVFTWNAFKIDCEPASVLAAIEPTDLGLGKFAGGVRTDTSGGSQVEFKVPVNPEQVRQNAVDGDLAIAEIMRQQTTREAAVRAHAADRISGTVSIMFELEKGGAVLRRTKTTNVTVETGGKKETRLQTQTVERRPLPLDPQRRRSTM